MPCTDTAVGQGKRLRRRSPASAAWLGAREGEVDVPQRELQLGVAGDGSGGSRPAVAARGAVALACQQAAVAEQLGEGGAVHLLHQRLWVSGPWGTGPGHVQSLESAPVVSNYGTTRQVLVGSGTVIGRVGWCCMLRRMFLSYKGRNSKGR